MNNLYKYKNINANLFIYQKYFKIYLSMYSVINLKKNCTSNDNVSTIQLYSTKAVTVICECFFKKFLLSPIQYVF